MKCNICENLEDGDTLYVSSDWDGGIGFDYIRDIKYCPVCGRKLIAEYIEPITEDCSMISCLKCEHNEHCHYLVKDIPWSDCPWKRRYEYNRVCSIINGQ